MSTRRAQDERIEGTPDGLNAIVEISDVPDAPTIGTASDSGDGTTASITFTAAATGGTPTTYRALSTPGSITGTAASSPVSVTGLTAGTAYTFQVRGENSTGNSAYSSASGSLTLAVPPAFESIATVSVGAGGTSSVTFSSIPGTYTHLQIRVFARDNRSGGAVTDNIRFRFNGDSASNYTRHEMWGDGGGAYGNGVASETQGYAGMFSSTASSVANAFGMGVLDIFDYASTSKHKTIKSLGGIDNGNGGGVNSSSSLWRSTSAITSIQLYGENGGTLQQYSHFALYGIKGS